ncbi:MAG: sulfurtransferase [Burkholderiales bacterium]|nr:sulfurtransferase [Burkholderiales bacterium]
MTDPDIRVVDVRWRSRYENGRGISFDDYEGYVAGHIPGAVFAGMIADLSDPHHPVPDMLVGPEQFARVMGRLGIGDETLVVAYDNMGFPLGSARLWWALSYYGHDRVRVLDGGLRTWQAEGRALTTEVTTPKADTFTPRVCPEWKASKEEVLAALERPDTAIVDCLTPELYRGGGERHLWGQRAGHIPGAVNVPYMANIDPALATATAAERERMLGSGRSFNFASRETLADLYRNAGVTPDREAITYCGRGYAGACGLLALRVLGYKRVRLYDGCWAEWSADPNLPVEVSAW